MRMDARLMKSCPSLPCLTRSRPLFANFSCSLYPKIVTEQHLSSLLRGTHKNKRAIGGVPAEPAIGRSRVGCYGPWCGLPLPPATAPLSLALISWECLSLGCGRRISGPANANNVEAGEQIMVHLRPRLTLGSWKRLGPCWS